MDDGMTQPPTFSPDEWLTIRREVRRIVVARNPFDADGPMPEKVAQQIIDNLVGSSVLDYEALLARPDLRRAARENAGPIR